MKITRTSIYSGKTRTRDLPVTQVQIDAYLNGAHIQDAFANLSAADREFILTGVTDREWKELFAGFDK